MLLHSTRDKNNIVSSAVAIASGISPDGGLYVPDSLPSLDLADLSRLCGENYISRAAQIMSLFLDDYDSAELLSFAEKAYGSGFDTPSGLGAKTAAPLRIPDGKTAAPLRILDAQTAVLELWHGPTCAFKDMALQMLPHLLTAALKKTGETRSVCVLVATSGDTGKAALEGFRDVSGTSVAVFYPQNGVSDIQKAQMLTQAGENVFVCAVNGNFDDAQTGVKRIFADTAFAAELSANGVFLSSANSINFGRLLPQIVYYISAYCDYVNTGEIKMGEAIDFCVPTGNFGNILAGWYAKQMGLPVGRFICASNSNNVLTDFIKTGVYDKNRDFFATISPSMDILVSSNLERLLYALCDNGGEVAGYMSALSVEGKYKVSDKIKSALFAGFAAGCCGEAETKAQIKKIFGEYGYLMDTHTAVASRVLDELRMTENSGGLSQKTQKTIIVSTASPYKFAPDVLSALTGETYAEGAELSGDGFELSGESSGVSGEYAMQKLFELSGVKIPTPLKNIADKAVRFSGVVERDAMADAVRGFIG